MRSPLPEQLEYRIVLTGCRASWGFYSTALVISRLPIRFSKMATWAVLSRDPAALYLTHPYVEVIVTCILSSCKIFQYYGVPGGYLFACPHSNLQVLFLFRLEEIKTIDTLPVLLHSTVSFLLNSSITAANPEILTAHLWTFGVGSQLWSGEEEAVQRPHVRGGQLHSLAVELLCKLQLLQTTQCQGIRARTVWRYLILSS